MNNLPIIDLMRGEMVARMNRQEIEASVRHFPEKVVYLVIQDTTKKDSADADQKLQISLESIDD